MSIKSETKDVTVQNERTTSLTCRSFIAKAERFGYTAFNQRINLATESLYRTSSLFTITYYFAKIGKVFKEE